MQLVRALKKLIRKTCPNIGFLMETKLSSTDRNYNGRFLRGSLVKNLSFSVCQTIY